MSPRTPTLPPTDLRMWRRLLSRAHPDAGGEHELFIWTAAVRDVVCGEGVADESAYRYQDPDRIPYAPPADFSALTRRAVRLAGEVPQVYGHLLRLLGDCHEAKDGTLYDQQQRGASYKSLAAIGHKARMSKSERVRWYRIAEAIPLSQRHAGHILGRMQQEAA